MVTASRLTKLKKHLGKSLMSPNSADFMVLCSFAFGKSLASLSLFHLVYSLPSQLRQLEAQEQQGVGFFVALTSLPGILPSALWFPAILSCLCCLFCLSLETGSPQNSGQVRYLPCGSCSQRLLHSAPNSYNPQPSVLAAAVPWAHYLGVGGVSPSLCVVYCERPIEGCRCAGPYTLPLSFSRAQALG